MRVIQGRVTVKIVKINEVFDMNKRGVARSKDYDKKEDR